MKKIIIPITKFEQIPVMEFCEAIIPNIDNKDYYDKRNVVRTPEKVYLDNFRAKCSELAVVKLLSRIDIECEPVDMKIYELGIGDSFDIITKGASIDVKTSTPGARNLLVEVAKEHSWKKRNVFPDYFCVIGVNNIRIEDIGKDIHCDYLFGSSMTNFKTHVKLHKRGSLMPSTQTPLKADNFILHKNDCNDITDFVLFMKNHN